MILTPDSPYYAVVIASSTVGFQRPGDVPWWKVSSEGKSGGVAGTVEWWKNKIPKFRRACRGCREIQVEWLENYQFNFTTGRALTLGMWQCGKCGTIFWRESDG